MRLNASNYDNNLAADANPHDRYANQTIFEFCKAFEYHTVAYHVVRSDEKLKDL